jgi:hypothetical protein
MPSEVVTAPADQENSLTKVSPKVNEFTVDLTGAQLSGRLQIGTTHLQSSGQQIRADLQIK